MSLTTQLSNGLLVFFSLMTTLAPALLLALVFIIPFCPDSTCDTYWRRLPYNLLQLVGIPVFFFVVTMCVLILELRGYFSEHFEEFKCKPWFMPFVSLVRPEVTVTGNATQCLANVSRVVNSAIMSPMMDIASDLSNSQNIHVDNLAHMHHQLERKSTETGRLLINMNNQLGAFQSIGRVLMIKMGAIFSNTMALVYDMYYMLVSVTSFFEQVIMAPQILLQVMMIVGGSFFATGLVQSARAMSREAEAIEEAVEGEILADDVFTFFEGVALEVKSAMNQIQAVIATTFSISRYAVAFLLFTVAAVFKLLLARATEANNSLVAHERLHRSVLS
jgi:hypothetical protein